MSKGQDLNLNNILDIIDQIPETTCGGQQPKFLFELSMKVKGMGEVVEIGTNVGKSTIALAFASKVNKRNPIYTIDIYEHPDIVNNLSKAGVIENVIRIVKPSHLAFKDWDKPIELLWIDGDHSYRGVKNDLLTWSKFLIDGGMIAFHDYPGHKNSKIVWEVIKKYLFKNPYNYRVISDREAGSIIVFQKIKYDEKLKRGWLTGSLFWIYRDIRTILVQFFPNQARKYKARKMKNRREN